MKDYVLQEGKDYYFDDSGNLFACEDGVFVKYDADLTKSVLCYGGERRTLFDGKQLYITKRNFYV